MVTLRKPGRKPGEALPAAAPFNVYEKECPARAILARIGDKWALLILDQLREGPMRFNALKREISGVSQKVLSQVLKNLERDGLIARAARATVPVTVEYRLTPLGETLTRVASVLIDWAEAHMGEIQQAQAAYDAARDS